jgi:hypothetical protein
MSDYQSVNESSGELQLDKASVVYDGKTGKVVLVHQVAVLPGAKQRLPEDISREALELAKTIGVRGALKALNVAPADLVPGEMHKVDLKRLTLVTPRRARRKQTTAGLRKKKR